MFRRDVDYCSGAFLMTHRAAWDRLGGFDERYAPAYYEEVDYCMRLREMGLRVVYEPKAAVDHFEFGSQGNSTEAHRLMQRNQPIFRESHAAALASRHLPNDRHNILAARSAVSGQRRLLVIDDNIPLSEFGSGFPRTQRLLNEAAALGWLVTFYPLHVLDIDWTEAYGMLDPRIEICSRRALPKLRSFLEERRGFYDVIVVSRPHNMRHLRAMLREQPDLLAGVRLVYDAEALYAVRDLLLRAAQGQAAQRRRGPDFVQRRDFTHRRRAQRTDRRDERGGVVPRAPIGPGAYPQSLRASEPVQRRPSLNVMVSSLSAACWRRSPRIMTASRGSSARYGLSSARIWAR